MRRLNTLQFLNFKIITVLVCEIYATPYMNKVLSLLKFMQSLGDVIASLEYNQSSTHTQWIERNLSLELIYCGHVV